MEAGSAWRAPALLVLWVATVLSVGLISVAAWQLGRRILSCFPPRTIPTTHISNRLLGASLVCVVCILWTASSVAVQVVFEEVHYRKPFFLTYFCNAMLVVYLPFYPSQLRQLCAFLCQSLGCGGLRTFGQPRYSNLTSAPTDGSQESSFSPRLPLSMSLSICLLSLVFIMAKSTISTPPAHAGHLAAPAHARLSSVPSPYRFCVLLPLPSSAHILNQLSPFHPIPLSAAELRHPLSALRIHP